MNFTYRDGNNNKYTIHNQIIKYDPVKPEFSSSGLYDGGDAVEKEIKLHQVEELERIVQIILSEKKEGEQPRRTMGSGYIFSNGVSVILSMRSSSKLKLEKNLKDIITNE